MFDRDNNVFQISHLRFPKHADCKSHLKNTLVDGVNILDICLFIDIFLILGICT